MDSNMKVKLVFSVRSKEIPGWPCIGYDFHARAAELISLLKAHFPEWSFTDEYYNSYAAAAEGYSDNDRYDGVVVFNLAHGTGITNAFMDLGKPGVIVDGLYGGSGDTIRAHHRILKERLPIITVLSSDFQDTVNAVKLLQVKKQIATSRILLFKNFQLIPKEKEALIKESVGTGTSWKKFISGRKGFEEHAAALKQTFGCDVTVMTKDDLMDRYYDKVEETAARAVMEKWVREAVSVAEPNEADLLKSAKMYLALMAARTETGADAVSIDCIMMYFTGVLSAYPCLANFQMMNDGIVAVCESDLDSILSQLAVKYIADRPAMVSDPVVDTASNQIIYAHCVASNRCLGRCGAAAPYHIRSHAEDNCGASVQVIMPLGHDLTTVKFDIRSNSMSIHNAKAVGNVHTPLACRTKLAAQVPDARVLLDKWDTDRFSWHKVTVYGDYRQSFLDLAKLYRTDVVIEDER